MTNPTDGGDAKDRKPQLTALVVAHNEEAVIAGCLETLAFADELIVVLDKCTDSTAEIATRFGARTLAGSWDIEGDRRNAGIDLCSGDWIVEVDADERVSPALAAEIRACIDKAAPGYFRIPFDNYVGDRLVKFGWGASWGVAAAPRLFSAGSKRWGRQRIHPALDLKGPARDLTQPMRHLVDKNISDMIARLDRYTTARAQDMRENGLAAGDTWGRNIRRFFSRFYKCYVRRKGYREGGWGFLIAVFAGLYPLLSYAKARLETHDGPK